MSNSEDKKIMEKLCGRELSPQEVFEMKQNFIGFFGALLESDKKQHPELYKPNGKEPQC